VGGRFVLDHLSRAAFLARIVVSGKPTLWYDMLMCLADAINYSQYADGDVRVITTNVSN